MDAAHTPDVHDPLGAFTSLVEYLEEVDKLLFLSRFAISNLKGFHRLTSVLARVSTKNSPGVGKTHSERRIKESQEIEELANAEMNSGFPILCSHSVVAIWSALEATVPRFCVDYIVSQPEVLNRDHFSKVKLPCSMLNKDNRTVAEEVASELIRQSQASLKPGIGRFSILLDSIGMCVPVSEETRKTLFELSKVRNLIVHQFSIVDQKFNDECPWMKVSVGQRLTLTPDDYQRYRKSVGDYAANVIETWDSNKEKEQPNILPNGSD